MTTATSHLARLSPRASCASCWNWLPHVHYPIVGYCTLWAEATFDDYYCPGYVLLEIKTERLYWCSTCRIKLTREEAALHWSHGHRIFRSAYVEPDVKEEIYEG